MLISYVEFMVLRRNTNFLGFHELARTNNVNVAVTHRVDSMPLFSWSIFSFDKDDKDYREVTHIVLSPEWLQWGSCSSWDTIHFISIVEPWSTIQSEFDWLRQMRKMRMNVGGKEATTGILIQQQGPTKSVVWAVLPLPSESFGIYWRTAYC